MWPEDDPRHTWSVWVRKERNRCSALVTRQLRGCCTGSSNTKIELKTQVLKGALLKPQHNTVRKVLYIVINQQRIVSWSTLFSNSVSYHCIMAEAITASWLKYASRPLKSSKPPREDWKGRAVVFRKDSSQPTSPRDTLHMGSSKPSPAATSPLVLSRFGAIESISSMKMMAGEFFLGRGCGGHAGVARAPPQAARASLANPSEIGVTPMDSWIPLEHPLLRGTCPPTGATADVLAVSSKNQGSPLPRRPSAGCSRPRPPSST